LDFWKHLWERIKKKKKKQESLTIFSSSGMESETLLSSALRYASVSCATFSVCSWLFIIFKNRTFRCVFIGQISLKFIGLKMQVQNFLIFRSDNEDFIKLEVNSGPSPRERRNQRRQESPPRRFPQNHRRGNTRGRG
jgi:hypothetical protein